jgi:hypothetical protein
MGYFDLDLMERRHRQAIRERKSALYTMYAEPDSLSYQGLTRRFDRRLKDRHTAFLDRVSTADVGCTSATLGNPDAAFLNEVVRQIRTGRRSTHLTERRGSVSTSRGVVYWAIRKPGSLRELLKAAWTGRPFKLELWHEADVAGEAELFSRRDRQPGDVV